MLVSALLFAALAALLAAPAPAPAAPPKAPKGFFGVSGRDVDLKDLRSMDEAGVGVYRALFHFRSARRYENGRYNWKEFDRLVGRTASRGIQLLPLLYGTPDWIYPNETTPPIYDQRARAAWAGLLRQLVRRYGPRGIFWRLNPFTPYRPVTAWQIWNEPNSGAFWAPGPDPKAYARLVQLSAGAIHAIDPNATIVSAGIVADPRGLASVPGPRYLDELVRQPGARAAIDKYGYHPYARKAPGVRKELLAARRVLRANHLGTAPLWVTEVGWGSGGLIGKVLQLLKTPAGQKRALRATFTMALKRRDTLGVEKLLWYYWRDHADPLCVWCRSAGLLENSYERKPAFRAFRSLAGG